MRTYLLISLIVMLGCQQELPNQEAADRLSQLYEESLNTPGHPYHNGLKAAALESQLVGLPPHIPVEARYETVYEYLKAGNNDKVLELVNPVIQSSPINNRNYKYYRIAAMANLRKGEQDNCFHAGDVNACTLPFTSATIHKDKTGASQAVKLLNQILAFRPSDLESRWLLNIAAAAVDEEKELPENLKIKLTSPGENDIRFKNVFTQSGMGHAGGASLEDFDNDGDLDIFTSSYHLDENVKYYKNKDGKFQDHTRNMGLKGITGGLNFIHGDVNNDGFFDILILRGGWLGKHGNYPPSLLINQRGQSFLDETERWGLLNYAPTQTAVFSDLDQDGDLDLVIGYENRPIRTYINQENSFVLAEETGIQFSGFTKGLTAGDVNNDGLPDLFVSVLGGDNLLFINKGDLAFSEASEEWQVKQPWASFVTWFFDYNNDGFQDLFVGGYNIDNKFNMINESVLDFLGDTTNFSHPVLYKNVNGKYFQNVTDEVGLNKELYAMGGNFGDVNNDGFLDFYLGTGEFNMWAVMPNRLFINEGGEKFVDHTFTSGLGMIQKGHGISFGDVDQDGDLDIFHTIGGAVEGDVFMNYLYENQSKTGNSIFLKNLPAGATVTAFLKDSRLSRTVGTGGSFGNNTLDVHLGLGDLHFADSLIIADCTFYELKAGNTYIINLKNCSLDEV